MNTSKGQLSQFSSSLESGLVEMRIVRNQPQQFYIGKYLVAIAFIQNRAGNKAALLLEFESIHGNLRRCIVARGDLVGRGVKRVFTSLLAGGYCYERKQRNRLLNYLCKLGAELPEIIVEEIDRTCLDLDALVFDRDLSND